MGGTMKNAQIFPKAQAPENNIPAVLAVVSTKPIAFNVFEIIHNNNPSKKKSCQNRAQETELALI